ncbi:MAG: ATP-binding protein [Bacteroides sp.]|nr:ATP-binding protein [Prevotella sp.]MCM1408293.1 ATP-binding protein [Treponema brennaborense]MCM1470475.1 ATP-binding protein [Bacteroides sp.]
MGSFAKRVSPKLSKLTSAQAEKLIDDITTKNETFSAVMQSLNTGLVICDKNWRPVLKNKAAERHIPFIQHVAEMHISDMSALPIWESISDAEIASYLHRTAQGKKNTTSEEFSLPDAGDAVKFISVSTQSLVKDGKFAGTIVKIDDITEKRRQETLLRRMENLASLTNLAASVAHEIKNPLGSISIHIQLIQKAFEKAQKEENAQADAQFVEKHLDIVTEEINRLNQIITDFLTAVRPVHAELEFADTTELLNSFIPFFEPDFEAKGITLKINLMDKPPHCMIDAKLFKQAMINLIQNAIAAMPSGGVLCISSEMKEDRLAIIVADNGIGMDEQTMHRIFEPYFTTKASGTGLGLTMVYKIIKEFSGDIQVKSRLGGGTMFVVTLPVPQKELRLLEYTGGAENAAGVTFEIDDCRAEELHDTLQ